MVAPLKLKSEKFGRPEATDTNPVVSVLVDTGVYHLDGEYDYLLPKNLEVEAGDWVSIPFRGKNHLGLVVKRSSNAQVTKLEFVNRRAKGPKLSEEFLQIYRDIASHWAVPIFDVLRFVNRSENSIDNSNSTGIKGSKASKRSYFQLSPNSDEITQVRLIAEKLANEGPTLVVVPEARTLELLKSDRFSVGMRSAILSPITYKNILVLREESEHHYEIKSPGFNTRDVALIRNKRLGENLLFVGFSPSLEMFGLIKNRQVNLRESSGKTKIDARPSLQGELIPSALLKVFKESLNRGPVLVLAPRKGYGRAISCAKCRNIAYCPCGGRLTKLGKTSPLTCAICSKSHIDWQCLHCSSREMRLMVRGIERIAEEFGHTFPNTEIHISTAEKVIEGVIGKRAIVLSTIGAAPIQIYSAALFLEGIDGTSDVRSDERVLSDYFRYTSLSQGRAMLVENVENPKINALIKWDPFKFLDRNYQDLLLAKLPPTKKHLLLKTDISETARIYSGLQGAVRDQRLPSEIRVIHRENGLISIFFGATDANRVLEFIREFQRRRSMAGKSILQLRVDPYLLG